MSDLAKLLADKTGQKHVRLVYGVATADNTVQVNGATTAVELPALIPVASGDYCAILEAGADRLIIGPVDTSGFVERSGDTMTGPLSLPVNDVTSTTTGGGLVVADGLRFDDNTIQSAGDLFINGFHTANSTHIGPSAKRVTAGHSTGRLHDHNWRQFIRGATETSGATLVPVFLSGQYQGTTNASGDLSVSYGETLSSPVVVASPSFSSGSTSTFSSLFVHNIGGSSCLLRCYNHTGSLLTSTTVTVTWIVFGRVTA